MTERQLFEDLHALACAAAREAATMIHGRLGEVLTVETKISDIDLVTEVDRASEAMITDRILAARPEDGIIGEEGTGIDGSSGVAWLIDPIDGTTSYVYGLPGFSVSIAAQLGDIVVAGVVLAPAINAEFSATLDGGATKNGAPVRCRPTTGLDKAMIATGFSPELHRRARQGSIFAELIPQIRDIRRMGSAALDLAVVAGGHVDAYFEVGLSPWDYAAGELIAREAGAKTIVEPDAATGRSFVAAASPGIADEFFTLLRELGADEV